ncbi:MAG: WecB/TagA/CpsF family glycosyltransferase, partial [Kiritimatiellales bacterium]
MTDAVSNLLRLRHDGAQGYVCVTSVHGVIESQRDEMLRQIHNRSLMTVPDGMPTVWMGREYGFVKMGRVYGPDFMLAVCNRTVCPLTGGQSMEVDQKNYTHFLYGSTEKTL